MPFPHDTLEAHDPQLGLKWAWNASQRYGGAGSFGSARAVWVTNSGVVRSVEGRFFNLLVRQRSDREDDNYRAALGRKADWGRKGPRSGPVQSALSGSP